jgi:hypothetical protein
MATFILSKLGPALSAALLSTTAFAQTETNATEAKPTTALVELLHTGTSTTHIPATPEQHQALVEKMQTTRRWTIQPDAVPSPRLHTATQAANPNLSCGIACRPRTVTVQRYQNPACVYIPFYSTTYQVGTIQLDPSTGLPDCVAQSTTLGAISGYPNASGFAASWEAIMTNDGTKEPDDTHLLVSGCGSSFGPITVQWDTYNSLSPAGTPAFAISANVYNGDAAVPIMVGSWITYYVPSTASFTTLSDVVPPGGTIPCPAN